MRAKKILKYGFLLVALSMAPRTAMCGIGSRRQRVPFPAPGSTGLTAGSTPAMPSAGIAAMGARNPHPHPHRAGRCTWQI